ncbi:mediator of RNA polymerase II transcription subunit 17 [Gigaspora margarita]|uniref:Mediator of RNA polymerase II transcription subunit 17 n=1 Tax=Gigaspora margarita TaxID=4874 RepID=A0A8H3WXH0_GIGMA|nr:mediator of RNA polymerase II transcription subunit 17 [Gigaspora margarita]
MKANIDSIKKAPSSDDAWTSNIHMYRHRIQLLKQQERVLNWTRGTPRESSGAQILNQVIHLLKYYFFCKHIRDIVNASTRALSSGGVSVQIRFIFNLAKGKDLIEDIWKKIGND